MYEGCTKESKYKGRAAKSYITNFVHKSYIVNRTSYMNIRIVSPSGVIDPVYIDGAETRLRAWGYIVSEGAHARDTWGRFAGTDEHRLADLIDALHDPSVDYILCSRGGYGL